MKINTVNLYQYDELSPAAQENMRETDPDLILATRYRRLCERGTTRDDLARLVALFPERYAVFAYLLDYPNWGSMAELNH